jgi:methionyl-tRNA formyltransferase
MRIVFMGTPDFSVPVLDALIEAGHEIAGVVTQPDKPKGRGKAVAMTPVKEKALEHGLSVYQPLKVRTPEFVQVLRELKPDVMVVVAFGQILTKEVLDIPPLGCVNVHASLLPKYRGAAPIQWAVIDGEKETGVTTMMMDEGIDTGDMLEKEIVPIEDEETGDSLHDKLMAAGARLIVSTLKKIQDGTIERTPQTDEETCYARMLKKDMGDVDWSLDAHAIERLVRGLNSWPGTYTKWNGKTVKIWKAKAVDREYEGALGEAVYVDKETILVKTGKGCLSLLELQPEGKKRMAADAFLRGYPVDLHTVFQSQKERNV